MDQVVGELSVDSNKRRAAPRAFSDGHSPLDAGLAIAMYTKLGESTTDCVSGILSFRQKMATGAGQ